MLLFYSFLLTIAFLIMSPLFILRRQKYASGFRQRLGNYPEFQSDDRKVVWLHAVSVGETNAARPLVEKLLIEFPHHRIVISTTTRTGQDLARKVFGDKADAVFYFPFDWKFSVRKALKRFKPSLVLLMETEIWPRFINESKSAGTKVAIVNGRLSERSFRRYSLVRRYVNYVLQDVRVASMQGTRDASRIVHLGMPRERTFVSGNLKFDQSHDDTESDLTKYLRHRFGFATERPLIVAASTHEPEEKLLLEAYRLLTSAMSSANPRLLIAPRHPERFNAVAKIIASFTGDPANEQSRYGFARRSAKENDDDTAADVILLDSVGELRSVYSLAEIVFVGGSLIPHGGQSVLEPAAAGKAIVTGPHTDNFADAIRTFLGREGLIQLRNMTHDSVVDELFLTLSNLLEDKDKRRELGKNAVAIMQENKGATENTVRLLRPLLQ